MDVPAVPGAVGPLTRDESFRALTETVARLDAASRSTLSAAVKPALVAGTGYRFDERAIGFASFREFLAAARHAGAVELEPGPGTSDVWVLVRPHHGSVGPALAPTPGKPPAIRADLWQAFVDWAPGWTGLWDRHRASAVRFHEHPSPSEDPAQASWRALYAADAQRFVPIRPIDVETTLSWMAGFSDELAPGRTRTALLDALKGPRAVRTWTGTARSHGLYDRWHERRLRSLRGVVLAWAARNDVDLTDVPVGGPTGPPARTADTNGAATTDAATVAGAPPAHDPDPLRGWLLALVQELPADELALITVPARYAARA